MEKWGVFPMASTGDLRAKARLNPEKGPEGKTKLERPTGVNQKGAIAGLRMQKPEERTPVIGEVDEGLLKESLGEG